MIDIATLRAMAAAGASVEVILAAVEAEIRAEGARVQASKELNAARQQKWRDRQRNVTQRYVTSRNVTDDGSLSFLLTSSESASSKKESKKKERAKKSQLPDDWQPKPEHFSKVQNERLVLQKADEMRDWAKSKAIMRADWDATFNGFLSRAALKEGNREFNGAKQHPADLAFDLAGQARELERKAGIAR